MNDHLAKPFEKEKLLSIVKRYSESNLKKQP